MEALNGPGRPYAHTQKGRLGSFYRSTPLIASLSLSNSGSETPCVERSKKNRCSTRQAMAAARQVYAGRRTPEPSWTHRFGWFQQRLRELSRMVGSQPTADILTLNTTDVKRAPYGSTVKALTVQSEPIEPISGSLMMEERDDIEDDVVTEAAQNDPSSFEKSGDTDTAMSDDVVSQPTESQGMSTTLALQAFIYDICKHTDDVRQVKMFLNDRESESWTEKGLGTFAPEIDVSGVTWFVVASSEDASEVMLRTRIDENTRYAMQGRTVITWLAGSTPTCLSFANGYICCQAWSILQLAVPDRVNEEGDEEDDDAGEESSPTAGGGGGGEAGKGSECHGQQLDDTDEDLQGHLRGQAFLFDGFSSFLEDYDDVRNVDRIIVDAAASNSLRRVTPALCQPPRSQQALSECLEGTRILEKCAATKPTECTKLLGRMTESAWLNALWELLDESIRDEDFVVCSSIAELLCKLVALYASTSNPFVGLTLKADSYRVLDSNDPLVRLLSDANYEHFFKAMEYEPELRKHGVQVSHVDFLKYSSQFKEVICTGDSAFRVTCHFIYRILYLRDVCLPRHLDEMTIQRLSGVINTGYSYLCRIIQLTPGSFASLRQIIPVDVAGARFLLQLLAILRSNAATIAEKPQVFAALRNEQVLEALEGYLTESCVAAVEYRRFVRECIRRQRETDKHMMSLIENDTERRHRPYLLSHDRLSVQSLPEIAVEIFHHVVEYNPGLLRAAILNQASKCSSDSPPPLWSALCRVFRRSDNEGVHTQLSEIFRRVLDPALMESPERDDFLSIFYDRGVIDILIDILLTPAATKFEDLLPSAETTNPPYFLPNTVDVSSDDDDDNNDETHDNDDPLPPDDDSMMEAVQRPRYSMREAFVTPRRAGDFAPHDGPSSNSFAPIPSPLPPSDTLSDTTDCSPSSTHSNNSHHRARSPTASAPLRRQSDDLCPPPAKRRASAANANRLALHRATDPSHYGGGALGGTLSLPQSRRASFDSASISATPKPQPVLSRSQIKRRLRLQALSQTTQEELLLASRSQLSFVKCQISEILAFCVMKHNCRIKYRTLQQNLHTQLIQMSFDPVFDQFLAIYAVKFLRACLTAQAEYYARVFVRHDVFAPILFLLRHRVIPPKSRAEGSLLESVIFELFGTIRMMAPTSAAVASLLQSLFEKHCDDVENLGTYYSDHCDYTLFKQLRAQYDELSQQLSSRHRRRDYWRGCLTEDEEDSTLDQGTGANGILRRRRTSRAQHYEDELEYDRGMQDAYFEVDDEEATPTDSTLHQTASDNMAPASTTAPGLSNFDTLDLPICCTDMDEDDTDVPDFLKAKTVASPPARAARGPIISRPDDKPVRPAGLKLTLATSPSPR